MDSHVDFSIGFSMFLSLQHLENNINNPPGFFFGDSKGFDKFSLNKFLVSQGVWNHHVNGPRPPEMLLPCDPWGQEIDGHRLEQSSKIDDIYGFGGGFVDVD